MADAPEPETPNADEIQKSLEKQIAALRKEITKINRTIAERSTKVLDNAHEQASDLSGNASSLASRATQQLRTQAQAVSEIARENPGTTTSVLGIVGIVAFLLGVAVGQTLTDTRRRWY
ncbi:hypothetical protein CU102_25080 [Phyllobacterium brassicacearum]|uniref:DUF3618 domain-containing protein n=1 Tax=Phyllobacterium brassicacearum TaxID=314235 RepID=A0A2P7B857_9HYPH|nr:hypothetical protein [Phyllobacterium brassicacearum]PSH62640.1 hypothetical protein CU102_25080 [Phyllobacterium brassicacearum]TDQ14861.1 hypothetical protein DEV91_13623 [Phyllobacterium brassicacearum]